MEVKHDDIQLLSSCSVCGGADQEKDRKQKLDQLYQQMQNYATGYTNFSSINIILIVVILLLLFGGIYLLRRSPQNGRRR